MDGVEAAVCELAVVLVGAGGERDEALEQALCAGLAALFEQGAGMVGVLEVAVTLVASAVAGSAMAGPTSSGSVIRIAVTPMERARPTKSMGGSLNSMPV